MHFLIGAGVIFVSFAVVNAVTARASRRRVRRLERYIKAQLQEREQRSSLVTSSCPPSPLPE
jgi:hypothetical protein